MRPCADAATQRHKAANAATQTFNLETRPKESAPFVTQTDIFANKARARQTPGRFLFTRPPRAFVPTPAARGSNRLELLQPLAYADAPREQRDVPRPFQQLEPRARNQRGHLTRSPHTVEEAVGRPRDDKRGRLQFSEPRAQVCVADDAQARDIALAPHLSRVFAEELAILFGYVRDEEDVPRAARPVRLEHRV